MKPYAAHSRTSVLCALLHWEAHHSTCPSISELCEATGLARPTVHKHLLRLRRCGLVDWEPSNERTLHSTVAIVVPKVAS